MSGGLVGCCFFGGGGVGMVDFENFTCDLEGFMIPVTCF